MKKFLLSICILVFSTSLFSQTDCPTQFLRNNGNASSCASHIRLYFNTCPTSIPTLDSIKINGLLQPETFTFLVKKCNGNNIYIDYCISDDNLPPAAHIKIFLTYLNGTSGALIGSSACEINTSGPTPVILSNYRIQRSNNNEVSVSWQTDQEISSDRFEIERSYNNSSYEKIGTVLAAGFSSIIKTYIFSDKVNNSRNVSFYRIKMIDKDGTFAYTETKSVKASGAKSDMVVFPNPCHGSAKITITEFDEPTEIQLMDVSGRLVKSVLSTNSNTTEINNLQKGTYFVRISGKISGSTNVRKLSVID